MDNEILTPEEKPAKKKAKKKLTPEEKAAKKAAKEKKDAENAKKPIEEVNYNDVTIEHIIEYCKRDGNEVARAWLKEFAFTKMAFYPKDKKGIPDKTQEPEYKVPDFLTIRNTFYAKFLPALKPVAKPKEKTMYEKIKEL
jgi:hypothetical protein